MADLLKEYPFEIFYSKADNPLRNFYIPALSCSVQYDRSAGYFSSAGLAIAAAGVARLIGNNGRMRLLVGADLSEDDVEAIRLGYDLQKKVSEKLIERFPDTEDALLKKRLEVLAWMVADGTLDIRVVLPTDEQGLPIPANIAQDYYHPKSGIFTDAENNQVAFSGSVNESFRAWMNNYEELNVFSSWAGGNEPERIGNIQRRFDNLWLGKDPHWIALDIPEAAKDRLVKYRPKHAPSQDPLEVDEPTQPPAREDEGAYTVSTQAERILFQFVKDAPFLPNAVELGAATSALVPWPHQSRVANTAIERFPQRALLSDEVGLGKTIEAGLVIRQLWISGRIKRCLILTPKSVLKQWQEELYEKFGLDVPRYDRGAFWNVQEKEQFIDPINPWNSHEIMLVGSQLAKRSDRQGQFLEAKPWDLVVVDEAHHARRKDFLDRNQYRPNRLLELLNQMRDQDQFAGLLLMTATPMQVHPIEVWDLLMLLGMGGRWGANEDNFLDFYKELRAPFRLTDWDLIFAMVADHLASGGQLNQTLKHQIEKELGRVSWSNFEDLCNPDKVTGQKHIVNQMGKKAEPLVQEFAWQHTPVRHFVFRNTRDLLRKYQDKGILKAKVPTRIPERVRVPMQSVEMALYDRIDEYISHFYQKYEKERRGLGFVMTVYRRRLTSSFYAVSESLDRRLKYLKGEIKWEEAYQDDDTEQDELELDLGLESEEGRLSKADRKRFEEELHYVENFINDLKNLSVNDSKLEYLKAYINRAFRERNTVLVFTQYTDTLDFLREQLRQVYESTVACYSGRGGETWNGIAWVQEEKEVVKNLFRDEEIRILICTESASEGLNLQTCGVLINYDMPWNPMRVEQRIGRIDRIGQRYDKVWIWNFFYKDTIEDQIFERLDERISSFENVIGKLQPILSQVGEITRRLALLSKNEREVELEERLAELRKQLDTIETEALNLDDFNDDVDFVPGPRAPLSLMDLEELLTQSNSTRHLFRPHPDIQSAYLLKWDSAELPVTFSKVCFDQHPSTIRFLTFGSPILQELLSQVEAPSPDADQATCFRASTLEDISMRMWFVPQGKQYKEVATFKEIKKILEGETSIEPVVADKKQFEAQFKQLVLSEQTKQQAVIQQRRKASYLALRAKAQRLLQKAAYIEVALGQVLDMFEEETYPTSLNENAITGLARRGYPWSALLMLASHPDLSLREDDEFFVSLGKKSRDSLKSQLGESKKEAKKLVGLLNQARTQVEAGMELKEPKLEVVGFSAS